MPRARAPLLIALGVAGLARVAAAAPCGDAGALRAALEREATHARHWTLAWRITYTAGAVGQFAAAASGAFDHDDTVALWVGGAKSSLAALSQWISPLGIDVPPATGDACADRAALGVAAERAGREERRRFWFSHLAGLAVTLGGAVVVAELTSWETGLESFAASYPVGLLATYTMPRASWARIREPAWTARLAAGGGRYALVVGGRF